MNIQIRPLCLLQYTRAFICLLSIGIVGSYNPAYSNDVINPPSLSGPSSEFHIGRLVFEHHRLSNWGPGRPWWRIDWPEAEHHLIGGLNRYTVIDVADDSAHLSLMDDAIFDYPWVFAQQVGRWQLTDDEISRLSEYLRRGGFLVVDDFHGPTQWEIFQNAMDRALPGFAIYDLPENAALLQIHYELDQLTQIPGRRHIVGVNQNDEAIVRMPHSPPRWKAIQDSSGRLMVAINFNMDMGDAWEHADDPGYPVNMTSLTYRFGINYVVYAMTH